MQHLVTANYNRTYNPTSKQSALCDIKRMLTSRDTTVQSTACECLIEFVSKYSCNPNERNFIVLHLLSNDITVFLCEAISNLDFSLFRSVVHCMRLLYSVPFFAEEHAAHCMAAVTRALAHYTATDAHAAVDACLHFITDLLYGVSTHKTTPALSYQSAYSVDQLLACFTTLADRIRGKPTSLQLSASLLQVLISYQPDGLDLKSSVACGLAEVLEKWFELLTGGLNQIVLLGNDQEVGIMLSVVSRLGVDVMRLIKILEKSKEPADFVDKILKNEQEIGAIKQSSTKLKDTVLKTMNHLVVFVKDNLDVVGTEEYRAFLLLLLKFMYENTKTDTLPEFCDILFSKGYLIMLPKSQIARNDRIVHKISTQILGEILKVLATKYLITVKDTDQIDICINDIHTGLTELEYGIERTQDLKIQLQKNQPNCSLIYIYFYCQCSENPEESTAHLLPHLIDYILKLPKVVKPPAYVIKALWLVFAMSNVSNGSLESLEQRIYLEKATDRLVAMLEPEADIFYTHNPAILFWSFTSLRISDSVRLQVLSQWLTIENTLPEELIRDSAGWELVLDVLRQSKDNTIVTHCMEALNNCIEKSDQTTKEEFSKSIWTLLPQILSKALINCNEIETNICHILDLAIAQIPSEMDESVCPKVAVLIATLFSKNTADSKNNMEFKYHYEFVCLKLCLILLNFSMKQKNDKVLLTYISRAGFLPRVLTASNSLDDNVASTSLQLLICIIYFFSRNNYIPKSVLELQTDSIIRSLRRDSGNERGSSLLNLIHIILSSGLHTPVVFTYELKERPSQMQQSEGLRNLMYRIQIMLCGRDFDKQWSCGWKALNSVFKHAIVYKNDSNLVATLTSQPFTRTLILFQLTQTVSQEFLEFLLNWLTFLKMTIITNKRGGKYRVSRNSPVRKMLRMLKNNLSSEEMKDSRKKILEIVNEILEL